MMAGRVDASDLEGALEQIAYTADEIEALIPLLRRVPAPVFAMPLGSPDTSWSITAAFAAVYARDAKIMEWLSEADLSAATDWKVSRDVAAPDATAPDATAPDATAPDATAPDASYEGLAVVLANVAAGRRSLVAGLQHLAASLPLDDRALLGGRLFELIHDDAEIMREIAYALHSGPVTGEAGA